MGIGERLREKRKQMDLSAKELSERSGVPEKTIYRIETNEVADPKISSLKPIIEVLGCSADEMIMDRSKQGLSGRLRVAFERSNKLPIKEKALLIQIIDRWVNSVNTEKLYLETLSKDQQFVEMHVAKEDEKELEEMVNDELEVEHNEKMLEEYEAYHKS